MPFPYIFPFTFGLKGPATVPSLAQGATNDNAADIIRKHLSPAIKGPNTDAIIEALASGDAALFDYARSAFDQLYTISSSGQYLDRNASNKGISKPKQIGMSDELFRQLAIKVTNSKLTEQSVLEMLEIFYGSEATRGYVDSVQVQPFTLADGDELNLLIDEKFQVNVVFNSSDFNNITAATAIEVAFTINRFFKQNKVDAMAVPMADPETELTFIRIYSGSLGLGSSVRVTGGKAQNSLTFPQYIDVYTGNP